MSHQQTRVDWPAGFDRTAPANRTKNRSFDVSLSQAFDDLETELDRLDVEQHRYSFDAQQRQTDQRPYSRANPDDPSFVLRWTMDDAQYAVACDRYTRLRDNVRTVGLYIREKRKMESRPVVTGESEFANARLPPGDDEEVIVAGAAEPEPHEVLDVAPDAPAEVVKAAYRAKVQEVHPDHGGDEAAFRRVNKAKEAMLSE